MDEKAVAQELIKAGYRAHESDGVWWCQVAPMFCKPVDPFRTIEPMQASPKLSHSFLGYSHVVSDRRACTKTWDVNFMPADRLGSFNIKQIKPRKRTAIRKALKHLEIRRIESIQPELDTMNEICISTAKRTGHGKPAWYYTKDRNKWERFMIKEFSIGGREWWGAYLENRLIAYYYAYLIESTMHIAAAKSHSDYLKLGPNDAFVFTFTAYCRELNGCKQIIYGDWSTNNPELNRFKSYFGFEKREVPEYRHERVSFSLLQKAAGIVKRR